MWVKEEVFIKLIKIILININNGMEIQKMPYYHTKKIK